jgi:3-hydroxyacyl-[acyl-carrier-protein] dehydratase
LPADVRTITVLSMQSLQLEFAVPATHPSLPGHFPGRPVVPGVVLLDCVERAASDWLGAACHFQTLPQVKFLQPLLPGESALMQLEFDAPRLRFSIRRGDVIVCSGVAHIGRKDS